MKCSVVGFCAVLGCLVSGFGASAASVSAQARLSGICDNRNVGQMSSATAECLSSSGTSVARAEFGSIGVLATASGRLGGGHPIWSSVAST